jgi:predicted nucleic acid-binding protein
VDGSFERKRTLLSWWRRDLHTLLWRGIRGSMVTDAYFAALALESGCEWVTTDRDYARFAGLAWRHPLVERAGPQR